jgi:small subunit ribosomal protein S9
MKPKAKEAKPKEIKKKIFTVSGIRKESVARATIGQGTGAVRVNSKPIALFNQFQQLILSEPLVISEPVMGEELKNIDINVIVRGGGVESQIEAARLAIARALIKWVKSAELKNAFAKYDKTLLVADIRRKEARKWGDSKARAKRQKSYR